MSDELVLGLPAERFRQRLDFAGWRPHDAAELAWLLDPTGLEFRPRRVVETDPAFVQIIPYVVLSWNEQLFHYTRTGGSETRLRARRSVGLGGHINPSDGTDPYRTGLLRELREEVECPPPVTERVLGLIYDPRTPVGQVHVGVVHRFELPQPTAHIREAGLHAHGFAPLAELLRLHDELETWSQFVVQHLLAST
jgi:predicted NUDIX family phosphoesterase